MSNATVIVTYIGKGEPVVNHQVWLSGETREINEGVLSNLIAEHGADAFAVQANADVTPAASVEATPKGKRK